MPIFYGVKSKDDVQIMTGQLREGIYVRAPEIKLSGEVEFDEVYVVAGHKGNLVAVKNKGVLVDEIVSKVLGDVGL
jgi:glutamine amidotransferase PdxT